jgi:hypothetical protein
MDIGLPLKAQESAERDDTKVTIGDIQQSSQRLPFNL